jgi:hypothetical protein
LWLALNTEQELMPTADFKCNYCGKVIVTEEGACKSCLVRVGVPRHLTDEMQPIDAILWGVSAAAAIVTGLLLVN